MPGYTVVAATKCQNFDASENRIRQSLAEMDARNETTDRAALLSSDIFTAINDFEQAYSNRFVLSIMHERDLQQLLNWIIEDAPNYDGEVYIVSGYLKHGQVGKQQIHEMVIAANAQDALQVSSAAYPDILFTSALSQAQIEDDLSQIRLLAEKHIEQYGE